MRRFEEKKKSLLYAVGLAIIMIIAGILCHPVLYLNDDITMRSILSGAYTGTPDGHAVYMQYPLTGLLALCYRLVPKISWMELFYAGCLWGCMCLITGQFSDKLMGSLISIAFFLPFYVYMHYTIVAALIAGCAVFLLCRGEKRVTPLVLLWIAYMIRGQVGLLALPFVLAALVWRCLENAKDNLKQRIFEGTWQAGVLVIGMMVISGLNALCYDSDEWKEYQSYNDSRTQLYDYTNFLSTDLYAKEYASYGMTKEEYQLLFSYNTMLEKNPDAGRMQEIADSVTAGMQEYGVLGMKDCLKKYYLQIRYSDFPYNYVWLGIYAVVALLMLWGRSWLQLCFLSILGIGRSSIWMFLIAQGRFPERVSLSLYMIELLLLTGMLLGRKERPWKQNPGRVVQSGYYLCLLLMCGIFINSANEKISQIIEEQTGWELLKAHCEEYSDKTYLLDVFSAVSYADRLYEEDASNLMLLGGWLTQSPLANERLEALGGKDAAEVLYYNDNARLLADSSKDMTWIEEYLQNRFGDCELVQSNVVYCDCRTIVEYEVR